MTLLANRQYNLHKYIDISNSGDIPELSEDVIKKINNLAQLVGAPTYKKTPVFKHRQSTRRRQQNNNRIATITADDWEAMRNFKTTILDKPKEGIDTEMKSIRSSLNKLTASNYDEICVEIGNILSHVLTMNVDKSELEKVGVSIFEIGSINKFWSELYANLYKDLIEKFPIMMEIYQNNFKTFMTVFDTIQSINAEEDYDLFCKINLENEKRRALSSFFVHLMNNDTIKVYEIMQIIIKLRTKFIALMNNKEKINEVGEIAENLCIIVRNGINSLRTNEHWSELEDFIKMVSELSVRDCLGVSTKTIFKFMDLYEEI
jgi:hypothetical protein